MEFLKIRKTRRELKEVLHHAKHVRHMFEDIADPERIDALKTAEKTARETRKSGTRDQMESAGETLISACEKMAPPRRDAKIRENVEVLFVAIAAAMALRAYFLQPFKIPTGSMQPTLYGITVRQTEPNEADHLPARIVKFFWKGEVFLEKDTLFDRMAKFIAVGKGYVPRAQNSGYLKVEKKRRHFRYRDNFDADIVDADLRDAVFVGNRHHNISPQFTEAGVCREGEYIKTGDSLIKGVAKAGDYILVNRIKYNFVRPKRGDITVFDAQGAPGKKAYYIKRMVGLPGETISLDPKYLLVNGEKPADPRFEKLFSDPDYMGYEYGTHESVTQPILDGPDKTITLKDNQYLFFGDNTDNSLDGRYFGGVDRKYILGPAFFSCVPFDRFAPAEVPH